MSLLSNFLNKTTSKTIDVQLPEHQIVATGQLLSDRYLISELLGRGAMGEVYLAEDTVLGGVSVAVKVISKKLPSKQMLDNFSREAQIGAFLGHHNVNIVRVLDFGIHNDDLPFYVMEYVYGTTLADEIQNSPLALNRCIKLMSQICTGLQSAHQGVLFEKKLYSVIHRDLKPANIFITENSSFGEIAKILDFGIAEFFLPVHKSTQSEAKGTLAYASSDQLKGKKLEPSADIYSFGVTMFEALTGELPIVPPNNSVAGWIEAHSQQTPRRLREAAPHLLFPESLEILIQQCLYKKPSKRPQMIQEVLDRLKDIAEQNQGGGIQYQVNQPSHEDVLDELFSEIGRASTGSVTSQLSSPISQVQTSQDSTRVLSQPSVNETVQIKPAPAPSANETVQIKPAPSESSPQSANSSIALAQLTPWPSNKPIAEIVFAQSLKSPGGEQAALWSMLKNAKLQKQALPLCRIEFALEYDPHPMLAWVTILHDQKGRMRCLPCFLDLVDPTRRRLIHSLEKQGHFLFLLFDSMETSQPVNVSSLTLDSKQRQQLHQGVLRASQFARSKTSSSQAIAVSKKKLKARYRSLKSKLPQVLTQTA